jgi:hypothetical protein
VAETKDQYLNIAQTITNRIDDVEALLTARGLKRREQLRTESKKLKEAKQEEVKHIPVKADDKFAYSNSIQYALAVMLGMVIMVMYQRLSSLDDIIKHTDNNHGPIFSE